MEELALVIKREGIPAAEREALAGHTSFRIGGPAGWLAAPQTAEQLAFCRREAARRNVRWALLGNGTNVLAPDGGFDGLIIKTTGMCRIEWRGEASVWAEAGAPLSRLASLAAERSLSGLAFAQGIPGTVGGAVIMNAGAYGGEMAGCVLCTRYLDENGEVREIAGSGHGFSYRESVFKAHPEWVLLGAELRLVPGSRQEILDEMADYASRRREKQPLQYPSAGSVYKRPAGYYAGKLIEDCGLRGHRIGGAQISEKHCGFIINRGGATAKDVLELMETVEKAVKERFGVTLEREIRMLEGN